jgi:hypothetical protein
MSRAADASAQWSVQRTALVLALAIVGCAPAGGPCTLHPISGPITATRVFWVNDVDVPIPADGTVAGLDIDGTVSERGGRACVERVDDATSSLGDGDGVDNALATFVTTIESNWSPPGEVSGELDVALSAGAIALAIVVEEDGTDSCGTPSATVTLRRVARTDGTVIALDERRAPVDGQPLALREVLATGRGTNIADRYRATIHGSGAIPLARDAVRAPLGALGTMEPAAIAFELVGAELARGVIAGSWDVETLVPDLAAGFPEGSDAEAIARTLLTQLTDLPPEDATGACTRVSAGVEIGAVEIDLAP